jgi:negative regulator of replication initiation
MPLSQLHNVGMAQDRTRRASLARMDDNQHRSKITAARKLIYSSNYAVDSAAIQRLLKAKSWTPTIVRAHFFTPGV